SVLATGLWYKFAVSSNGIYRITYQDLLQADINPSSVDPRTIRLCGNGGGMLPEANNAPRIDDLQELAIRVVGEDDGQFNEGDYILFYGESQVKWTFSATDSLFHHRKNIYADKTCYFLTFGGGNGKRLIPEPGSSQPPTHTIIRFNDFAFYEKDDLNLIKSGREWYDIEYFDVTLSRNYSFAFADLDVTSPAYIGACVAARSTTGSSTFQMKANNQPLFNISIPQVSGDFLATYAREKTEFSSLSVNKQVIDIQLVYSKPGVSAIGYLNYLEVNVMRNLKMSGNQLNFRSVESSGIDQISEFILTTQGQLVQVWDVTDGGVVKDIQTSVSGGVVTFRVPTDTLKEFIAFDGTAFLNPEFTGRVENQDLHGAGLVDYVIVAYPDFLPDAERLAGYHREANNLSVLVTTPEKIFNEFSSGSQDLSAIRDFLRMMYEQAAGGGEPKYLLLFGDASYDYKNREPNNTNFVLVYESPESLDPVDSYITDDYFVLLDPNEGQGTGGSLDLGVGRLPVMTVEEATAAVDKILHYCANSDSVKNDWRNVLGFVADDGDGNLHMNQVEDLTDMITSQHPVYNIDKIYLDAYQQIATPGGQRSPEVNDAITKRVDKGALIINYTGHGGELGWAHERVLEVPDIKSWTNFDNLPVFVTATCEFSRYDDPGRVSAGEWVFLNPMGGGIALFTTTRPTFAGSNFALATNFYGVVFNRVDGDYMRMGDVILQAKNATSSSANTRKFVLLGDPAMQMAYPKMHVVTTSLTGDTLKALSEITISGEVRDENGKLAEEFNGLVFPTVFDKPSEILTLGNDGDPPITFYLQKNQIYKGKVQVTSGEFVYSFIVPKDIAYKYGQGKISYYARSAETDANGFDEAIVVGGFDASAKTDDQGPDIDLFVNTPTFFSGGITNQNPVMLAYVSDESGINTVGNGIGHDITAVLDGDSQNPLILNDYYVANIDTYKNGQITYPFFNLTEGIHTLSLKVWDVFNNSSEAVLSFKVINSNDYVIDHLYNYPNPFQDQTLFSFETNQTNVNLNVEIRIFTIYGKLIRTIRRTLFANGFRIEPIHWDGTIDGGSKISTGTYIYRVTVELPDGTTENETAKLVVIR
ncbi:MAG: type IX secretion system sortase PorU, partial [bacterium]